jgi:SAM-dependent methyltransferase
VPFGETGPVTFSAEWDSIYEQRGQMSVWPWSDLVSIVMRYARPSGPSYRVLELGCGAGANVPFFMSLRADYYAIEGSPHMVAQLRKQYPQAEDRFVVGDFTREIPVPGAFDLIVDRSSLTHNCTGSILRGLQLAFDKLKPGGALVGIDWFSNQHSEMVYGDVVDDEHTRNNFSRGQFAGVGKVHFSDEAHLRSLLSAFDIKVMEHKILERREPGDGWRFAAWNFLAVKRREERDMQRHASTPVNKHG